MDSPGKGAGADVVVAKRKVEGESLAGQGDDRTQVVRGVMKSFVYEYLSVSYGGVKFVMPETLVALRDR